MIMLDESQGIIKLITLHPEGGNNVCTKLHGSRSQEVMRYITPKHNCKTPPAAAGDIRLHPLETMHV